MHELTLHGPEDRLDVAVAMCFDLVGRVALAPLARPEVPDLQCELPAYMPSIPPEEVHDEARSSVQLTSKEEECTAGTDEDGSKEEECTDEELRARLACLSRSCAADTQEAVDPVQEGTHARRPRKSRECCIPWWDDWAHQPAK